jgi:hypothetical protein
MIDPERCEIAAYTCAGSSVRAARGPLRFEPYEDLVLDCDALFTDI